jgi:hypothetical protein
MEGAKKFYLAWRFDNLAPLVPGTSRVLQLAEGREGVEDP